MEAKGDYVRDVLADANGIRRFVGEFRRMARLVKWMLCAFRVATNNLERLLFFRQMTPTANSWGRSAKYVSTPLFACSTGGSGAGKIPHPLRRIAPQKPCRQLLFEFVRCALRGCRRL